MQRMKSDDPTVVRESVEYQMQVLQAGIFCQLKAKRYDWRLKVWVGFGRQVQLGVKTGGLQTP